MNPLHNGPHMHPEENNPAPDPNTQESSTENEVRDSLSRILKVSEETAKNLVKGTPERNDLERDISLVREYIAYGDWQRDNDDQVLIYTGLFA